MRAKLGLDKGLDRAHLEPQRREDFVDPRDLVELRVLVDLHLAVPRGVGVPGCEWMQASWDHFQAGQDWSVPWEVRRRGVDVPGCEWMQGWRGISRRANGIPCRTRLA